eukprot:TRINITY_DN5364_c1_g1_i1.p1 TRINITY_DN5364_c1_g1~~TRINITY_DN5364_c1_g1_i1.p1  ORF type:complete len:521 (-),score=83.35 TRINITY_DN5364_c1_g1_i1:80-1642(-)
MKPSQSTGVPPYQQQYPVVPNQPYFNNVNTKPSVQPGYPQNNPPPPYPPKPNLYPGVTVPTPSFNDNQNSQAPPPSIPPRPNSSSSYSQQSYQNPQPRTQSPSLSSHQNSMSSSQYQSQPQPQYQPQPKPQVQVQAQPQPQYQPQQQYQFGGFGRGGGRGDGPARGLLQQFIANQGQKMLDEQDKQQARFQAFEKPNPQAHKFLNGEGLMGSLIQAPLRTDAKLSYDQKMQFYNLGYLHIPNVIPKNILHPALRAINRSIGNPESPNPLQVPRSISSCPELMTSKVLTDLLNNTNALTYAEQLIGRTNRTMGCQIALRYPGDNCLKQTAQKFAGGLLQNPIIGGVFNQLLGGDDEESNYVPLPNWEDHWHIDGFPDAIKGLKTGEVRNFTMLLGILLSDVEEDNWGNLTVFPGSHHLLESFFRVNEILKGTTFEGIQIVKESVKHQMPQPLQLKGKAGDIFLCHYQLGHAIAPNLSPNIRYAIYFRLHSHRHAHETPKPECLTNIWIDYEGIQDLRSNTM